VAVGTIKFILKIVEWAIVLGCAGQLAEETSFFKAKAIESHQRGLMSLGQWSRRLESQKGLKLVIASNNVLVLVVLS